MKEENQKTEFDIFETLEEYIILLNREFVTRIEHMKIDLFHSNQSEVCGGLLARQVSLATEMSKSPSIWNGHIAPLILRSMVDTYITLAWIFDSLEDRTRSYIEYGIGQQKLFIEHLKNGRSNPSKTDKDYIEKLESWLESQRFDFLTEVNLGSWSGKSIRTMAEEAGCLDFYNYCYIPFSSAAHSMWNHVSRLNLKECDNPLHKYHLIPINPEIPPDVNYVYLSSKYMKKSFLLFDKKTGFKFEGKSSFAFLFSFLKNLK